MPSGNLGKLERLDSDGNESVAAITEADTNLSGENDK
jgi:hypothetical protein